MKLYVVCNDFGKPVRVTKCDGAMFSHFPAFEDPNKAAKLARFLAKLKENQPIPIVDAADKLISVTPQNRYFVVELSLVRRDGEDSFP